MRARALAAVPLLALLAACGGGAESSELTGTVLDPPFEVSSTPLVDTDGAAYSLTDDTDKDLTLVFFGYTNCPDICGQVMATLAGTLTRFDEEQKERVDVVFVTTDPARDDEAVTQDYVSAFDPSIIGLTGDLDDIVEVGKSLAVGVEKGDKLPSGGYDVTHGTQVVAIDADDEAPIMWDHDVSQAQLAPTSRCCSTKDDAPHADRAVRHRIAPRDPDVHPEPRRRRVEPRARPDPRLRAEHHPRHRARDLDRRAALGRPRRHRRGGQRPGDLGRAVRPGRRPALPRDDRLAALLRGGPEPDHRAVRLARRPRGLGGDRPRRLRVVARRADQGHQAAAAARRDGSRRAGGAGDRALGQLVQPGALRPAHRPAVGAGDRRRPPAVASTSTRRRSTRRSSTSSCGTWRPSPSSSGSTAASASATAGWPRSTSCSTRSAAAGSRTCASTTSRWTTSWGCGSTCGPPSCCSSSRRPASSGRPCATPAARRWSAPGSPTSSTSRPRTRAQSETDETDGADEAEPADGPDRVEPTQDGRPAGPTA